MKFEIIAPDIGIAHLVRCFWVLESRPGGYIPPKYLALADSSSELVFQYGQGFKEFGAYRAHLVAPRSLPKWRHLDLDEVRMFGVRFYPDAVHQLTQIPTEELANGIFDLEELFGFKGRVLIDQVNHANCNMERRALVTQFLLDVSKGERLGHVNRMVRYLLGHDGQSGIGQLMGMSGLSDRQLQRKFKMTTGFSASYFRRIVRFQSSRRIYMRSQDTSFAGLAYDCNYSDQSHFIREFSEFSGLTPKEYFGLIFQTETEADITRNLITAKDTLPHQGQEVRV